MPASISAMISCRAAAGSSASASSLVRLQVTMSVSRLKYVMSGLRDSAVAAANGELGIRIVAFYVFLASSLLIAGEQRLTVGYVAKIVARQSSGWCGLKMPRSSSQLLIFSRASRSRLFVVGTEVSRASATSGNDKPAK